LELFERLQREEGIAMVSLFERHRSKIRGMLSCLDRVVITGTLPDICHAQALERHLSFRGVRLFDYARWAEPMCEQKQVPVNSCARPGRS
jgi:hypothetical protein